MRFARRACRLSDLGGNDGDECDGDGEMTPEEADEKNERRLY